MGGWGDIGVRKGDARLTRVGGMEWGWEGSSFG